MQFQGSGETHDQALSGMESGSTAKTKRAKKRRSITEIPAVAGLLLFAASSACDRGVYNTQVTQETIAETICQPGYAKAVRPPPAFTNSVKQKLLKSAGYEDAEVYKYRLDYIVPVVLGGHPRKLDNFELIRRDGANNTKRKNRIEAKLQCLVCAGEVSLTDAQREATDWQAAYQRYEPVKCQLPKVKS